MPAFRDLDREMGGQSVRPRLTRYARCPLSHACLFFFTICCDKQDAGEDNGLTMAGFREFVADVACGVGSDDDLEAMLAPFIP